MSHPTDRLLQLVDPIDEAARISLEASTTDEAAGAMRDAILATDRSEAGSRPAHRRLRLRRLPVLALATTAIAVAAVLAITDLGSVGPSDDPSGGQAWAAAAVRVAREVPRLLPTEPGWAVTRADEMTVQNGSTLLEKGNRSVEYNWYPRSQYDLYFKDRQLGTKRYADIEIDGVTAVVFRYADTADNYFAMWKLGDYFVEARTQTDIPEKWQKSGIPENGPEAAKVPTFLTHFDEASFRSFVSSLRSVDIDTWLAAMPESVVKPQDNAATVQRMLKGVPLPDGFDAKAVAGGSEVRDRYQLGAHVTEQILCAWFKEWRAADHAGDAPRAAAAKRAVGTARSWPVFKLMGDGGSMPDMVFSDADYFSRGDSPNKQLSFEDFWRKQFCQTN